MQLCFICLQEGYFVPKLNKQNIYVTQCKCNGYVHTNCLKTWHESTQKCPICRIYVLPKPDWFVNYFMTTYYIALNCTFFLFISMLLLMSSFIPLFIANMFVRFLLILIKLCKN